MSQLGLFDIENRLQDLSKLKDPLEVLEKRIPWEVFRKDLKRALGREEPYRTGRPPFDPVLMFKVLVLQSLYNLSDHQIEFQIKDRLSFMRFLDLGAEARIPDEKTVWLYRETLSQGKCGERLFRRFDGYLEKAGYRAKKGMMVDATLVEVPRSRNTRQENEQIKEGETPDSLSQNPNVLRQKDVNARWTQKRGQTYFGYKNHINVDVKHKLIRRYTVTPANVHDSRELGSLLDFWNMHPIVYGDAAYPNREVEERFSVCGYVFRFNRKARRGHPLTEGQKRRNRRLSRTRARVEHVFGWMERKTQGTLLRGIGLTRAALKIGFRNLVYNLSRYAYLEGVATG